MVRPACRHGAEVCRFQQLDFGKAARCTGCSVTSKHVELELRLPGPGGPHVLLCGTGFEEREGWLRQAARRCSSLGLEADEGPAPIIIVIDDPPDANISYAPVLRSDDHE